MGTSLSSPMGGSMISSKSDCSSNFSSVCDSRSTNFFESPGLYLPPERPYSVVANGGGRNQRRSGPSNKKSSVRQKPSNYGGTGDRTTDGQIRAHHHFLWNFTRTVVSGVLPKFFSSGGSSAVNSGEDALSHQIQQFGKNRTMTTLSDETVLSKNTQSSGYVSRTSSSRGSRSSSPLDLLNEEFALSGNNADFFLDAPANKSNRRQSGTANPNNKHWDAELFEEVEEEEETVSRDRATTLAPTSKKSYIPQYLKLRRASIEDRNNNHHKVVELASSSAVGKASRMPSFLQPLYHSRATCRLPLGLLQNGASNLQQQQHNAASRSTSTSGIWNPGYSSDKGASLLSATNYAVKLRKLPHQSQSSPCQEPHRQSVNCPPAYVSPRSKTMIQASTSDLLRALGRFLSVRCQLKCFDPTYLVIWMRTIDRALILQGWQEIAFVNPANLVFVYMLIRDHLNYSESEASDNAENGDQQRIKSVEELHSYVLTCLYISYSYMGNEISYPLKPFVTDKTDRDAFWKQCVKIIEKNSRAMLRLNSSSQYFLEVFLELKGYA